MVAELIRKKGFVATADLIGIDNLTLSRWRKGTRIPTMAARKAVFLIWSLALHPEQVTSLWDIATFGRFHGQQIMEPPEPEYEI
jgi:hypothetical protein